MVNNTHLMDLHQGMNEDIMPHLNLLDKASMLRILGLLLHTHHQVNGQASNIALILPLNPIMYVLTTHLHANLSGVLGC